MSQDITGVEVWSSATAVASTAAITSSAIAQHWSSGNCALLIILAGGGPSVNITYTVGASSTAVFYSPIDRNGTSVNTLGTAITATSWISFSPTVAPFIKIVVTGDGSNGADTTVRAYLYFPETF